MDAFFKLAHYSQVTFSDVDLHITNSSPLALASHPAGPLLVINLIHFNYSPGHLGFDVEQIARATIFAFSNPVCQRERTKFDRFVDVNRPLYEARSAEYIQIYESIVIELFLRLKIHKKVHVFQYKN